MKETNDTGVGSVVRQAGEHHNPGGGVRLARFDGCRHAHSGQPANDPHERRWHGKEKIDREENIDANVAEEIVDSTNTVGRGPNKFGGNNSMIWDSGAGRSIVNESHVPEYQLEKNDHPGFTGPSGETIKVNGRTRVHISDEILGKEAEMPFIVANKVTRPILSGGDINDRGNITISSSRGAFVVSEDVGREVCAALMPHAKLAFTRAGLGRLYEHHGNLLPQLDQFFPRPAAE